MENKRVESEMTDLDNLIQVVAKLRSPQGCPWDREQTQASLAPYVIEEAFELVEAIESGNQVEIKEELGDYLFQVVLQAQVAADLGYFNLKEVAHDLSEKLVRRHPHVFSGEKASTSEEVWQRWHQMKNAESIEKKKPLFNTPKNLPALQVAQKIGKKTEGLRFDWSSAKDVLDKVKEEIAELEEAINEKQNPEIQHELGDVLFSVSQLARHLDLDAEACLRDGNRRFEKRFIKVLDLAKVPIDQFVSLSDARKQDLWEQAKRIVG